MNSKTPAPKVLLADIGGTNTRLALGHGNFVDHATIRRYANAEHSDLPSILKTYLNEMGGMTCDGACLAAAGPVTDGVAELTNLSWRITPEAVCAATGATKVAIINDLQAQGHALDRLPITSFKTILPGSPDPRRGTRLVVGIGTGFNAAPVRRAATGLVVAASECGHSSLPLRTEQDLRLARFVESAHGFAGVEDVLSGRGLIRLHAFMASEAGLVSDLPSADILAEIASGSDAVAAQTCAGFCTLMGRVVGDLALTHLPFEGIYLVGGIARAFAPYLETNGFASAFRDKGRFATFMDSFCVHVIEDDYAALEGCADHLASEMGHLSSGASNLS